MKDVAREAGVSVGTVSNYINGKKVRPVVAKSIEEAIKKLNYVVNNTARLLKNNCSPFVIFVVPTVWSPYFSELTFWIQKKLNSLGYKMILCISENDYKLEKDYVKMAEEQRAAGIISVSYSNLTTHIRSDIPFVSIEKESTGIFPLVTSDNYSGGSLAAKELQLRNVKRYYFIGTTNQDSVSMIARRSGFMDYCHNNGLMADVLTVASSRKISQFRKDIDKIVKKLLSENNLGDIGVFTHTDEIAIVLLNELRMKGIRVPEDIQIIGFDGWKITEEDSLNISSIRQPVDMIAEYAVKQLDEEIRYSDNFEIRRINLPVSFIPGITTNNDVRR